MRFIETSAGRAHPKASIGLPGPRLMSRQMIIAPSFKDCARVSNLERHDRQTQPEGRYRRLPFCRPSPAPPDRDNDRPRTCVDASVTQAPACLRAANRPVQRPVEKSDTAVWQVSGSLRETAAARG